MMQQHSALSKAWINFDYLVQQIGGGQYCMCMRTCFEDIYFNSIYLEYETTQLEKDKKVYLKCSNGD